MALVFSLFVLIPPVKVEVPDPVTAREVDVALVIVALVPRRDVIVPAVALNIEAKRLVDVALVEVEFRAVKFWSVLEARVCIPFVIVRRPFALKLIATEVDVARVDGEAVAT